MTALSGCVNNNAPQKVIQNKSGYFPNGMTVDGERWDGAYYILSREAYEAMFQ